MHEDERDDPEGRLYGLLAEARMAANRGDVAAAVDAVDTVRALAERELDDEVRRTVTHGCREVESLLGDLSPPLSADDRERAATAAEYLRSMQTAVERT